MYKVFVYGSLLSGMGNHGLLKEAKLIGTTRTHPKFRMVDLGWFPGLIRSEDGEPILGEVYEVDQATLDRLDRLEGYNNKYPSQGLYDKEVIPTEFGNAIVYIYNNNYGRPNNKFVANGDWRTHINNKYNE